MLVVRANLNWLCVHFLTAGGVEDPLGGAAAAAPLLCKVNEQKETENGLVDAECGEAVQAGNAGLCRLAIIIVPHPIVTVM